MELALLMMAAFIVKHFVCDFHPKIQTPAMYLNKGTYGHPGGIAHAFVHVSASCLILWAFSFSLESSWPFRYAHVFTAYIMLLVFEGLVHYHMDWFKMWWCKRKDYKPEHGEFWIWLGVDQMVHYFTYIIMVLAWM